MRERDLITGGAGFIGTHLSRRLLHLGYQLTVLDNFSPQIHGDKTEIATDLRGRIRVVHGDVRSEQDWKQALLGNDVVVHLAAETGTGQSMYQVRHYTDVNISGTSCLIELLLSGQYAVSSLIVASSRASMEKAPIDALNMAWSIPVAGLSRIWRAASLNRSARFVCCPAT